MGLEDLVLSSVHLEKHAQVVGAKSRSLGALSTLGYPVPAFVVVPCNIVQKLFDKSGHAAGSVSVAIVGAVLRQLPSSTYAVRSNALNEDRAVSACAGQFLSLLDVKPADLAVAIERVAAQAYQYLGGSVDQFSILIQEFIKADFSGVAFTRDPSGGREIVIEYSSAQAGALVGGLVTPTLLRAFHTREASGYPNSKLPPLSAIIAIEQHFNWPQDIEWCVRGDKWYLLQSRPITALTPIQYEQMRYLDSVLPTKERFIFGKTALSEIAPRPTECTLDLIERIYAPKGPVERVYQKYGIRYECKAILKIVGNELYCDREQELKSLFPACSFLGGGRQRPRLVTVLGLMRTLLNALRLQLLKAAHVRTFSGALRERLLQEMESSSVSAALAVFMQDYALIFEINLLAESLHKKLVLSLGEFGACAHELFNWRLEDDPDLALLLPPNQALLGNSLDLFSSGAFVPISPGALPPLDTLLAGISWYQALPAWKRAYIRPKIESARKYAFLREVGRWLTVQNCNRVRWALSKQAARSDLDLNYFSFFRLSEIESGSYNSELVCARRIEHMRFSTYNLPGHLTDMFDQADETRARGIAPGQASGRLVGVDQIGITSGHKILYTRLLTPDLVNYFDDIQGIVAERGGLLSHLGIMARERGIPVVVCPLKTKNQCRLGECVNIDGTTGRISSGVVKKSFFTTPLC